MMTAEELYRSSVGGKVSEAYIQASQRRTELVRERRSVGAFMNREDITHKEFTECEGELHRLTQEIHDMDIRIETLGEVREFCIDNAQAVVGGIKE